MKVDEPEQSEAIIIEEAVEVPDYAIPDQNFMTQEIPQAKPSNSFISTTSALLRSDI